MSRAALATATLAVFVAAGLGACKGRAARTGKALDAGVRRDAGATRPATPPVPQVKPPLPLAPPPADAESLTGLPEAPAAVVRIKRLVAGSGPRPGRNDLVTINLDGWRTTGQTFLSTRSRNRPVQQSLAVLAPGFSAAVATMQKGEKAMLWVPIEVGYLGTPEPPAEAAIYQVELIDFEPAPATPPDVAAIPAAARRSASGLASLVVRPGTGKVRPRSFDGVRFHYTGWTDTGRIFDSSEVRKQPRSAPVFREWPGFEEALTQMVVGERRRIWLPRTAAPGHPPLVSELPSLPPGTLCFELELLEITAGNPLPPVPRDLTAPPADAVTTPGGVKVKLLAAGTSTVHPTDTDAVEVDYTGWTADGRPFESTAVRGKPVQLLVSRAIPGWSEGLKAMTVGSRARVWVPEALAFKGDLGQPRGPVVFELTLHRIVPPPAPAPAQAAPAKGFGGAPPAATGTPGAPGTSGTP